MATIELYGFPQSTYVQTAMLTCEEKGAAYEVRPLEFRGDSHRALHPFLKMPAMRNGDFETFETLAIATYVDEKFDGPALTPASPEERATVFAWTSAAIDYLYPAIVKGFLGDDIADDAIPTARERLDPLSTRLRSNEFIVGENLSLADLFIAPMIGYATQAEAAAGLLDGFDAIADWRERLIARPAFRRAMGKG